MVISPKDMDKLLNNSYYVLFAVEEGEKTFNNNWMYIDLSRYPLKIFKSAKAATKFLLSDSVYSRLLSKVQKERLKNAKTLDGFKWTLRNEEVYLSGLNSLLGPPTTDLYDSDPDSGEGTEWEIISTNKFMIQEITGGNALYKIGMS